MNLPELQALSTPDKLTYLSTTNGIAQLQEWLSAGKSLHTVSKMLRIKHSTFYKVCNHNPDIRAITGRPPVNIDLSRPPAYRIIEGLSASHSRGDIVFEYDSLDSLWQSTFICNFYASYNCNKSDYYDGFLKTLATNGFIRLCSAYSVAYCYITASGIIKVIKSAP